MLREHEFQTGVIRPVECYKEAWQMIRDQYWLVFGITLVGMLIAGAVPIILMGPMMCGIYLCLFDKVEGHQTSFERLFKGFDLFLPSLVLSLIIMVPIIILVIVFYIPLVAVAMAGPRMSETELLYFIAGVVAVEFVAAVIMVCIHTLIIFSFPLLVDRRVSAWRSITLSASAVWANMKGVVGLLGVGIVVAFLGYLVLCIGVYLTLPLILAATTVAYRKVFPRVEDTVSAPPPPGMYQGL